MLSPRERRRWLFPDAWLEGYESGLRSTGVPREDDPRAGWADAARELVTRRDDGLLDEPIPTVFDESEWEWE